MSLTLSEIYIYPIKSLGGIRIGQAKVEEKGLEHDRRWMLVDMDNKFITQRKHHRMALLDTSFAEHGIVVTNRVNGQSPLIVPFKASEEEASDVKIWKDTTVGVRVSEEADEWFTEALGIKCKLVQMPEAARRSIKKEWAVNDENVGYADGYPYLIIGQSSLDDLNGRLEQAVPINRFRPNLVFTGGQPYEEDTWSAGFTVGEVGFKGLKPCKRCVLTTIDQATGKSGKEPLLTLSKYRKSNGGIIFGQHAIAVSEGIVRVGDNIILSDGV